MTSVSGVLLEDAVEACGQVVLRPQYLPEDALPRSTFSGGGTTLAAVLQ